ncbi:MAG TPA: S8 family serine peptidase [Longimicrobiales bacterium]|nr:S8 family serine peptidase [Longimicrobiales bacterium]
MSRSIRTGLLAGVVLLSACQDGSQPVAPGDSSQAVLPQMGVGLSQQVDRIVPGRILARLQDDADAAAVASAHGLTVERIRPSYTSFRGAVGSERTLAVRLGADARVVYAEPDYLRQTTAVDPALLWAFHNPGGLQVKYTRGGNRGQPVTSFTSVVDADQDAGGADIVSGYGAGGDSVAIASIDTGVDFTHTEFTTAHLVSGYDFIDNDDDPTDTQGHGTHTTGTMVGRNVGVAGVAGAASNVTVYVYRVCGSFGCPTSAIVDAIGDAADKGVVAMNLSLGGGSLSQTEANAIAYATGRGALVIASAGNDGTGTVSCPACDPNAISVAASNWQDGATYYTNWGPGLDITAPGGQMYSNTTEEGGIYSAVPGGYAFYQGTSMAAPQVTGTAAVVASVKRLSGQALRDQILGTTDDLGSSGYDQRFGSGRLNTYRAATGSGAVSPPTVTLAAAISYTCDGLDCTFDASASTGAPPMTYLWTFDDGSTASGVTTDRTLLIGTQSVSLRVDDASGSDVASTSIRCAQRGKTIRCN